MFRPLSGFKAQYQDLTLMVVSEFDEWRVIVHSPNLVLQGSRQYNAAKAKDHASALVKAYLTDVRHTSPPEAQELDWQPTNPEDWMVWKG
jgi:hypothetical protein